MDVYVERLHAALADALRRSRPRPFTDPVTVAEIYQDLVPYRMVRSRLGFEMNADYEHALLLMLAGIGGLAQLEPESAVDELLAEVNSPNPNVGLFRKFAACDVWIRPNEEPDVAEDDHFEPEPEQDEYAEPEPDGTEGLDARARVMADDVDVAARDSAPALRPALREVPAPEASARDAMAEPMAREEPARETIARDAMAEPVARETIARERVAQEAPAREAPPREVSPASFHPDVGPPAVRRCGFCEAKLPAGRLVRFCPHCGGDQTRTPCVTCGEALDREWRYCVACGAPQREGGSA